MSTDASPTAARPNPAERLAGTLAALRSAFGDDAFTISEFRDNVRVHLAAVDRLVDVLRFLRDERAFRHLTELGGVDYLGYPSGARKGKARFEVHYVLRNLETDERLILKVGVDDPDPTLPSAEPLWAGANWMEREVFDMYGIRFEGHPDLRRILMPDEFAAYPLRKDYPLRGRGERHNFPRLTREQS